jgi:succinate dehydrogenase / fumarate reductase iron-sulfur subunit
MQVTLSIFRYDPVKDEKPRYQDYQVDCEKGWTVLDALNEVKWKQDGSLSYRRSCRSAICGSCAMSINGMNYLACYVQVEHLKSKKLVIRPLPGFEVIKDLIVDMDPFYEKLETIIPFLTNDEPPPDLERIQSQEEFQKIEVSIGCILCGICSSSCPSYWADPRYVGPAALLKAYRFMADTRDHGDYERIPIIDNKHGLWRCHTIFNCKDACPKDLNPTASISELKKMVMYAKY